MSACKIAMISTGGTIEKTYDALSGILDNRVSVLDMLLSELRLHVELQRISLLNKDSLDMTEADQILITNTVAHACHEHEGVIVVHGTDRLAETGERLHQTLTDLRVPVVLTGAMKPWEMRHTDATQNLTEALLAVQLLPAGVYATMHNRVLAFPGVVKDRRDGTFRKIEQA